MEEGAEREGRACGVGCWILGVGTLVVDGVTEVLGVFSTGATVEKSISGPKSSSMIKGERGGREWITR